MRKYFPTSIFILCAVVFCGACSDPVEQAPEPVIKEICDDLTDNDHDTLIDCGDPDCDRDPACQLPDEDCIQPGDEDGDGLSNCQDPDCRDELARPACSSLSGSYCSLIEPFTCVRGEDPSDPLACGDNLDNDHDGMRDCSDVDCARSCLCTSCDEICDDTQQDENNNGLVDEGCPCVIPGKTEGVCADSTRNMTTAECTLPSSYSREELCGDNLDNDCNGLVDEGCPCLYNEIDEGVCQFGEAVGDGNCTIPASYSSVESGVYCSDNLDNDCDGFVDGEDDECM